MRIVNHQETEQKVQVESKPKKKLSNEDKKLSRKDWAEIMGTNMQTLSRKRGAMRRK